METPVAPVVADERQHGWEFNDRRSCTGRLGEVVQLGEVHAFTQGRQWEGELTAGVSSLDPAESLHSHRLYALIN